MRKKYIHHYIRDQSLKGFGWPSITSQLGPTYHVIRAVAFLATGKQRLTRIAVQSNTGQSDNAVLMLVQRQRLWVSIETALGEFHVFADVLV